MLGAGAGLDINVLGAGAGLDDTVQDKREQGAAAGRQEQGSTSKATDSDPKGECAVPQGVRNNVYAARGVGLDDKVLGAGAGQDNNVPGVGARRHK